MPITIAVAFDLNFKHAAEIFSGVADYVSSQRLDWQLVPLNFSFEARLMELAQSGSLTGVIGTFVSDRWIEGLEAHGIRAINLFNFSKISSVTTICVDDAALGARAARHLKDQGVSHFAFYGVNNTYYTQLRSKGYRDTIDRPVQTFPAGNLLKKAIKDFVGKNKIPGVFCSSDRLARDFIIEARDLGLTCGKDYLIVGINNDPSESIFAGIGISSFEIPARTIGLEAAAQMDKIIAAPRPPDPTQIICDGVEFHPRDSSLASPRARVARRAQARLQESLSDPTLQIENIASELGLSRRGLELVFKERIGDSPYRFLSRKRLEHAKKLLSESNIPIMEVGRQCGYPEPHHFSAWFKQHMKQSPKKYRSER